MYNGMSLRGVIVGIKKKSGEQEEELPAKEVPSRKTTKQELPDPDGLDAGIPCTELDNDDIIQRLTDKEEEVNDLKEQFEKMRLEFEALQEKNKKYSELKKVNDDLKKNFEDLDNRYWKKYYERLDYDHILEDILTEEQINAVNKRLEEKKQEVPKQSEKPAVRVIEDSDEQSESPLPKPSPTKKPNKVKSIISILDDSSDEEGDVKKKPINTKEHKIMKALEGDSLDFLD
jgi:hypothetical protein